MTRRHRVGNLLDGHYLVATFDLTDEDRARALPVSQACGYLERIFSNGPSGDARMLWDAVRWADPCSTPSAQSSAFDGAKKRLISEVASGCLKLCREPKWMIPTSMHRGAANRQKPATPEPVAPFIADDLFLHVRVETDCGSVVEDREGLRLVHPDARIEMVPTPRGQYRRHGIAVGNFQGHLHEVRASWNLAHAFLDDDVELCARVFGPSDGDSVSFEIRHADADPLTPPLASLSAVVTDGVARARYRFAAKMSVACEGPFQFTASLSSGKRFGSSPPLFVSARPIDDLRGIQHRLMRSGYEPGAPSTVATPSLVEALRAFQRDHAEMHNLIVDGAENEGTRHALSQAA